jgi:hypothetical protein
MCSINADICQFIVLAERDVDGIFWCVVIETIVFVGNVVVLIEWVLFWVCLSLEFMSILDGEMLMISLLPQCPCTILPGVILMLFRIWCDVSFMPFLKIPIGSPMSHFNIKNLIICIKFSCWGMIEFSDDVVWLFSIILNLIDI